MTLSSESKKSIKAERTKKAFAETAKSIIEEEGAANVSVRKVADKSGYSLRSIYNYFTNLDELLWMTRELMTDDLADYFTAMDHELNSIEDFKSMMRAFMDYFIDRPNVFFFFYCYPLDKSVKKSTNSILNEPHVREKFGKTYLFLMSLGHSAEDAANISTSIIFALYGLLTLYMTGNDGISKDGIYAHLDKTIEIMIKK
ncbi:MAG: TetR/AcrR family transcriptional regulator [Clostridia bacterium]|nr:TetR/AcrR family transcriptional regulator [Clostridia bacterium]